LPRARSAFANFRFTRSLANSKAVLQTLDLRNSRRIKQSGDAWRPIAGCIIDILANSCVAARQRSAETKIIPEPHRH
jgi:hypothetical protein